MSIFQRPNLSSPSLRSSFFEKLQETNYKVFWQKNEGDILDDGGNFDGKDQLTSWSFFSE